MEITESRRDGVVVLAVVGRLDASNSGTLEEKLLALVGAGEKRLVVDASRLDYISSAGLRVLLVAAKRLTPAGGTLSLCGMKDQIREVFDIAGFSTIFPIYRTQDEAAAAAR